MVDLLLPASPRSRKPFLPSLLNPRLWGLCDPASRGASARRGYQPAEPPRGGHLSQNVPLTPPSPAVRKYPPKETIPPHPTTAALDEPPAPSSSWLSDKPATCIRPLMKRPKPRISLQPLGRCRS